jgi:FixJ family two-component response regulator
MPGIGGVVLAERLRMRYPGVRVVYMSGYPETHLVSSGRLHEGQTFVAKPFTAAELREAVEQAAGADAEGESLPVVPN